MLLQIPEVLTEAELLDIRKTLSDSTWRGGVLQDARTAEDLGAVVSKAVQASPRFLSAALPLRIFPPQFHRYPGLQCAKPVRQTIRSIPGTPDRVRTDLTAVLFLSPLDSYEGGDLFVDSYGSQSLRLPPGHLALYPTAAKLTIRKVTQGEAYHCTLWVQSMIRDDGHRKMLYDMDSAIQQLTAELPDHPASLRLAAVYHNLLRYWAQT